MRIDPGHFHDLAAHAIPNPRAAAHHVDPIHRPPLRLVRAVECADVARAVRRSWDCFERCELPLPPLRYDEYLVVRNRADRDVREGLGGPGRCDDRPPRDCCGAPEPPACGGWDERDWGCGDRDRPAYGAARIGDVSRHAPIDWARTVEHVYRREATLPSGNVIDVFA